MGERLENEPGRVTDIVPRHPFTVLPDTDMYELTSRQQSRVYEAVGTLLIAMIESVGEPYVTDFVVTLDSGENVGYECEVAAEVYFGDRTQ